MAAKYNGINQTYLTAYLFAKDPSILPNDWYFTNSVLYKGSILYDLVKISGLPISHNLVAAALYVLFSVVALYYCYRLISEHFDVDSRSEALLLLLLGCFLFFKFLETTRASVLGSVAAPNPTAVAHAIAFVSIYYLVAGRLVLGLLATTLTIAIAVKGNFILVPIAALYIVLNRQIPNWKLVYMAIPLAFVLTRPGGNDVNSLGYEELLQLCEAAIWREENEAALNLQSPWALGLMIATFFVAPMLIKRFEDTSLRSFAWSVYAISLVGFIFGYFYTAVGYKIFPHPLLILIAPPRAMKFYTFIISMMFFAWALRTQALVWYERIAAVLAMVVLKGSFFGIAAAAVIATTGIALPKLLRRWTNTEPADLPGVRVASGYCQRIGLPVIVPLLLSAMILVRTPESYPGLTNIDKTAYMHIRIWSGRLFTDDATWSSFKALRQTPSKAPLLAYYRLKEDSKRVAISKYFNVVAQKPHFYANPAHHYLSPKNWDEAFLRELVVLKLGELLNSETSVSGRVVGEVADRRLGVPYQIDLTFDQFFKDRGATIFIPSEKAGLFSPNLPREKIGDYVLISFTDAAQE